MNSESATVGVAGLGFLGRGIAACLLAHDIRVVGFTTGERDTFQRARSYIGDAISQLIARAGYPSELHEQWPARYIEAASLSEFSGCDFVIESVTENLAIKHDVFNQLELAVGPAVPIASNTSALPIARLQEGRAHPERFLGMHFSAPAYITRFMELIHGPHTSSQAMKSATDLARRIGKDPCLVQKDVPGFIANRIAYAMYREAIHLLETGVADSDSIDRACRNSFGLWASLCGPLRWIDVTGGPTLYGTAMSGVLPSLDNTTELPQTLKQMMANGDRGLISGRGFFSYQAGDESAWEQRLTEQAWKIRLSSEN